MIPVKLAVAKAVEFAEAMLGASNILLEEVGLGKDGPNDVWMVTLSFPGRSGLAALGGREYKTFTVRGDTGEVTHMRIRELAGGG